MTKFAARVLLFAVCLYAALPALAAPEGSRFGRSYFEGIKVVTHNGKRVDFYDDLVRDRIVVIDFIYTSCTDICPLTTSRFADLYDKLSDRAGKDIFFYSITLDPENDSPEVLKQYAEAYEVGPGWLFLTGEPDDLKRLRWKLGERSRTLTEHFAHLALGNDKTGEWEKSSLMSEIEYLAHNVLSMDPDYRKKVRNKLPVAGDPSRGAGRIDLGRRHRGESLFLKACASCHTIGKGVRFGPDLAGVTQRRDHDWLVRFIMNPDIMLLRKDPVAVALNKKFEGVKMPNLSIREADAKDLVDYLDKVSKKDPNATAAN